MDKKYIIFYSYRHWYMEDPARSSLWTGSFDEDCNRQQMCVRKWDGKRCSYRHCEEPLKLVETWYNNAGHPEPTMMRMGVWLWKMRVIQCYAKCNETPDLAVNM